MRISQGIGQFGAAPERPALDRGDRGQRQSPDPLEQA
jgi:hypothetical protein